MQWYKAKICETDQVQPGLYKITYEYCDQYGNMQRVAQPDTHPLRPWDISKKHNILLHPDGSWCAQNTKDVRTMQIVLIVFGVLLALMLLCSATSVLQFFVPNIPLHQICTSIVLILMPGGFVAVIATHSHKNLQNKRRMSQIQPTFCQIINYKKVTRLDRGHTTTWFYPIVYYQYHGRGYSEVLTYHEKPNNIGMKTEIYVDMQNEVAFTEYECKLNIRSNAIWITIPIFFLALGVYLLISAFC